MYVSFYYYFTDEWKRSWRF